jgi:ABC-type transporter MlaC component
MKHIQLLICFLFFSIAAQSQIITKETDPMGYVLTENDTILSDTIELPEIIVRKEKLDVEARKQFQLLQNRVLKVYPYAKITAERLTALNKGMANLKTEKEKKKYFKIVENYLTNEFEAKLKKLSRKQGQILVKLIHRQTGTTTYELITNLKSGWKAFWSNVTARMFDINLKTKFDPYENNEDYLIESILVYAFETGRLQNQPPAIKVDFDNLSATWQAKVAATNK